MIIYTKKDATIIIPCGLGPSVCPDASHELQTKTVDSSTVLQQVEPDSGYDGLSSVTVEPYTLESKAQTITLNGTYSFTPSRADGLSSVDISVDVADIPAVLQEKTVNSSTERQSVTYDSGYDGLSSVTVEPYTLDSKTVNSSTAQQVITSSEDGLSSVIVEPYTLDSKAVDPSTSPQTVTSSVDGLSSVTVNAVTSSIDPDIQAGNIKRGVEILGVTGAFDGGLLQSKEVNSSTNSQSVTPDSGYYGLSGVTVKPYTLENKAQTITLNGTYTFIPTSADGLSSVDISVNVADIPAVVQSKSVTYTENGEYTVTPDQGYDGLSSVDISVNIPPEPVVLQSKTVNSSTSSQSVTYDSGYDGLSSVTVEPYVLDSKTVNSSTAQQVITSSVDGLSSVTVEPYVLDSKTVNSSTSQQTVTSSVDGLSSVTVEPYTLDSKTVNSSTAQQVITSDKDGLSSVTVNPYTVEALRETIHDSGQYNFTPKNADALSRVDIEVSYIGQWKYINPSINEIDVQPDEEYEGLSRVTIYGVTSDIDSNIQAGNIKSGVTILGVNGTYEGQVINNQDKTVDPSTNSQSITADEGYTGLGTVTINPVNAKSGSDRITQNGTYTFDGPSFNGDYLSSLQLDVSVNAQDWYTAWKLGNKVDFSDVDLSQVMELESGLEATFVRGFSEDMITAPPKLRGTILSRRSMYHTFMNTRFSSDKGGVIISFPNLVTINGAEAMRECFSSVTNIKELRFPNLTSVSGMHAMYRMFSCYGSGAQLTEIYMPKLQTIGEDTAIFGEWIDDPSGASRRLTIHVDALKSNAAMWNPAYAMGNSLTYVSVQGKASHSIYLTNNPNLDAGAVYSVFSSMIGTSGTGKSCNFASGGLTVTDVANGKLRSTYNDCVSQGWTINNLTILPYSHS